MKPKFLELVIKKSAIHCINCENRINISLTNEEGIINVKANYKTQKVKLYYDEDKISLEKIRLKLESLGFPPLNKLRTNSIK